MTTLTKSQAFEALSQGATLVTGSLRLARSLHDEYDARQQAAGLGAWVSADILAWPAWVERGWRRIAESLFDRGETPPLLLNGDQDRIVWERIVAGAPPEGSGLLDAAAISRQLRKSSRLLHEWRPEVRAAEWDASTDTACFLKWRELYLRELRRNNWTNDALAADRLLEEDPRLWLTTTGPVLFAGFDEFTPRQQRLLARLSDAGVAIAAVQTDLTTGPRTQSLVRCRDRADEIYAAATWAAGLLEQSAIGPIGIVSWDLRRRRRRIEHTFNEVLHPESLNDPDAARAFNISLGRPLNEYPVLAAALNALELMRESVPVEVISAVLRSPFFGAADAELHPRGTLDAELRRTGALELTVDRVIGSARGCAGLQKGLHRFQRTAPSLPFADSTAEWARVFSDVLAALGWPGERPRNSAEYQAISRWKELLSNFAQLDAVLGPIGIGEARERLARMAAEDVWQPKASVAPIQILGFFETSGLAFEHLWIMGLDDEIWPQAPQPDPFIPVAAQRRHNMPGATSERELEFATRETARLRASAAEAIFSYPAREGDRELRPSHLLTDLPKSVPANPPRLGRAGTMLRAAPPLEAVNDSRAPGLTPGYQRGGTSLLKDFSACPFRAVAKHRLRARPLDVASLGLDASERGSLAHRCLAQLWQALETSSALSDSERVIKAIRDAVAGALAEVSAESPALTPRLRALEQRRLEGMLAAWIGVERQRRPFRVLATELKARVKVGGLELDVKADRIDDVEGLGTLIVDYKTGNVSRRPWEGDRPDEPQLPVYACTSPGPPPAGVAFAVLKPGRLGYQGIARQRELYPKATAADNWDELLVNWRLVIEKLAAGILEGDARVAPNRGACDECDAGPLCRVQEAPGASRG